MGGMGGSNVVRFSKRRSGASCRAEAFYRLMQDQMAGCAQSGRRVRIPEPPCRVREQLSAEERAAGFELVCLPDQRTVSFDQILSQLRA